MHFDVCAMRILRKFLRKPSGFVGVCCLWGVVLVLFSFVATYHLSRHHPTDLLTDSEDPVELERQLRRRIEGLQGERAVLGDEPVAGRVNWLMQSMENMKGVTRHVTDQEQTFGISRCFAT